MSPLSYVIALNREHFSQLGATWQSLRDNEILLHVIDISVLVIEIACDKAEKEKHISLSLLYTQSLGLYNNGLCEYVCECLRRVDLFLLKPELSGLKLLWVLWENMAAKALHHTPH